MVRPVSIPRRASVNTHGISSSRCRPLRPLHWRHTSDWTWPVSVPERLEWRRMSKYVPCSGVEEQRRVLSFPWLSASVLSYDMGLVVITIMLFRNLANFLRAQTRGVCMRLMLIEQYFTIMKLLAKKHKKGASLPLGE